MDTRSGTAGGRIGMWLFLSTEVLLFGGLFLLYAMYRLKHPSDFHAASGELDRIAGAVNTAVLITSSLFAALSMHALKAGQRRTASRLLAAVLALGGCFLVIKGFEWGAKLGHGLYPGSPVLLARPAGEILYFGLYFSMTGLHALHVMVGMSVFAVVLRLISRGGVSPERIMPLENGTLFWHLVDVIWIFLFPLFYLVS